MKTWRWFVGQVTRLRRSIVGVVAPDAEQRERADDHADVADKPAAGPPEHWVARVRRGAPGLLEPSLRRRGEPTGPPVDEQRVMASQTEREPPPKPLEEPEREDVPPEPPIRPRRPAPARAPLLRKILRRRRSQSAFPPAEVDTSLAPTAERVPDELHAATRRASEPADSPAGKAADRGRLVDETEPTTARRSAPGTDLAERSPQRSEVVEFEAPAQRRTAHEPAESPVQPIRADAARPSAANVRQAELAVDEIGPDRGWEPAVPSPAPKRESNVERLREPAVRRPASQRESSSPEPGPPPRSRAEPLSAVDSHPWPELPPPLDQVDGDVEAALRAWEHQRRIDHEQTRL
jgi:hypothetical protein